MSVLEPVVNTQSIGAHYDLHPHYKVWHDDVRLPPDCPSCLGAGEVSGYTFSGEPDPVTCPRCGGWGADWAWARTNDDAKFYLMQGTVREISLDHDLGGHEIDPHSPDAVYYRGNSEDNGMKLVEWMIRENLVPDVVEVHSWNIPAAHRMMAALQAHPGKRRLTFRPYNAETRR